MFGRLGSAAGGGAPGSAGPPGPPARGILIVFSSGMNDTWTSNSPVKPDLSMTGRPMRPASTLINSAIGILDPSNCTPAAAMVTLTMPQGVIADERGSAL